MFRYTSMNRIMTVCPFLVLLLVCLASSAPTSRWPRSTTHCPPTPRQADCKQKLISVYKPLINCKICLGELGEPCNHSEQCYHDASKKSMRYYCTEYGTHNQTTSRSSGYCYRKSVYLTITT